MRVHRKLKRPKEIAVRHTARQFNGNNFFDIMHFVYANDREMLRHIDRCMELRGDDKPIIYTRSGPREMKKGDWVVRDASGIWVYTESQYKEISHLWQEGLTPTIPRQGQRGRRQIPAFWCGVAFLASVMSLVEDFMGKDRYVEYVQRHWDSPWFTVPLAIVLLVLIVMCGKVGSKA